MNTYYVYAVMHRKNENAYVGCTTRIDTRWVEHKRKLSLGLHRNPGLQTA